MMLIVWIILLLLSFYLLAKVVDDYFVDSLAKISERLKLKSDVAGATFMAVGSSAPELFVAMLALLRPGEHAGIGLGTIVGSALFNILVIIGAAAVVKKALVAWQPIVRDVLFYSLSLVLLIWFFFDGKITLWEGVIFVLFYGVYVFAVFKWRKWLPYKDLDTNEEVAEDKPPTNPAHKLLDWIFNAIFKLIMPKPTNFYGVFGVSIAVIAGVSYVLVESAIFISEIVGIPEEIIALTVLAIGTSVPDLLSSVIVAKQGKGGMAISNAIGSNIFDILIGLGLPWLIMIAITGEIIKVETNDFWVSVLLLFSSVIVVIILMPLNKWVMGKKIGWFLIFLYVAYVLWEIAKLYLA